ncbi:unnamed protein product [Cyprideis torosa]|uniref:ATP-dependent DNA helicase n=1 Tax=Cyprideis torosa TaxID=163714 RepID=A0A7R8WJ09_9CRUS|nr:unnamed protein product [Cyprideis torosa]CAG0901418.1 unnamed protein product [Cyprideis torosa]
MFSETFVRVGTSSEEPTQDAKATPWIDALGRRYKLRDNGIEAAKLFLQAPRLRRHPSRQTLQQVITGLENNDPVLQNRFLQVTEQNLTVSVVSNVTPYQMLKFLFHVALTLGHYECELQLFPRGNMKEAFVRAQLLHDDPTEQDLNEIKKRLITEQYCFLPVSAKRLSTYIKVTDEALSQYFMGNHEINFSVPSISEIAISEAAEEQLRDTLRDSETSIRNILLETVYQKNLDLPDIPTIEQFKNATIQEPLHWIPRLTRTPTQSQESVREQQNALQFGIQAIQKYAEARTTTVKHVLFTGPPGAGKSKLTEVMTLFAISKGLTVIVTSLASERSRSCGGRHIHLLFPMTVTRNTRNHPLLDAQDCIRNLAKNPMKLLILQRTNVFVVEEIGLVSAEMYGVLDTVMKYVMSNDLPFGGKLVIANGDHVQLEPILGRPFWMSTHLMISFDIMVLKKYVRMANDQTLQDVLQLLRSCTISGEDRKRVVDAIKARCEFVENWNNVPSERLRVLTTKKAQAAINDKYLQEKRSDPNLRCVLSKSKDEILEGDKWQPLSGYRKRTLSNNALEPEEIVLFEGAIMCFTYNNTEGNTPFSQGGLCIIQTIPRNFTAESNVTVVVLPPGQTNFYPLNPQWQRLQVGRHQGIPILVGQGLFARRTQFPFRYYTVQNFHRIMGTTAQGGIATQLSVHHKDYRMWDLGQLVVLLSRVTNMDLITFVGNKDDNINAIEDIMTKTGKFTEAINERLVALDVLSHPPQRIITNEGHPFVPIRSEIPDVPRGYVYLLVCVNEPYLAYVGETGRSLMLRLREHNTGFIIEDEKSGGWVLEDEKPGGWVIEDEKPGGWVIEDEKPGSWVLEDEKPG